MRYARAALVWFCLGGLCAWCSTAAGAVQTIDARVEVGVVQFLADDVINSDTAFENLDETTSNLPLVAEARLSEVDPDTLSASAANALAVFSDPRASTMPDPNELGVDLIAFSFDADTVYQGDGRITETREVVFTSEEIGHPDGTPLQVTSTFFLDGFMLCWGDLALLDTPVTAQMEIRVRQVRDDGEGTTVLETAATFSHDSAGNPLVTTTGVLQPENFGLGESLEPVNLLGQVNLLTVGPMGVPYQYEAEVGETFKLEAEVVCRIVNQPFAGATVALGVPIDEFVDTLIALLAEPTSETIDIPGLTSGPSPTAARALPYQPTEVKVVPTNAMGIDLLSPFCGLLGIESMLGLLFVPLMIMGMRRRD